MSLIEKVARMQIYNSILKLAPNSEVDYKLSDVICSYMSDFRGDIIADRMCDARMLDEEDYTCEFIIGKLLLTVKLSADNLLNVEEFTISNHTRKFMLDEPIKPISVRLSAECYMSVISTCLMMDYKPFKTPESIEEEHRSNYDAFKSNRDNLLKKGN